MYAFLIGYLLIVLLMREFYNSSFVYCLFGGLISVVCLIVVCCLFAGYCFLVLIAVCCVVCILCG